MTSVGCDLHTRKQQVAVLDTATGEMLKAELAHAGDAVEWFYVALPRPVTVGIESTGYALWFHAFDGLVHDQVWPRRCIKIRAIVVRGRCSTSCFAMRSTMTSSADAVGPCVSHRRVSAARRKTSDASCSGSRPGPTFQCGRSRGD